MCPLSLEMDAFEGADPHSAMYDSVCRCLIWALICIRCPISRPLLGLHCAGAARRYALLVRLASMNMLSLLTLQVVSLTMDRIHILA